jgi:electron transfer flavoprotein alpha subunit
VSEETVLCYSEEVDLAIELVRIARGLLASSGGHVHAVVLSGAPADAADRIGAAGAGVVHVVRGPASSDPHVIAETLAPLVNATHPSLLLMGSTKRGREVAGRLAGSLDLPVATGVTGIRFAPDGLAVEREALSGNAVATERFARSPAIVAILPGTVAPEPPATAAGERREVESKPSPALTVTVEVRTKPGGGLEIEKAERIVTVGRGLQKKDDLRVIEALAKALRAEVGCTRPLAAEAGWLTDDHWIGLTGHRVHPKLYVAVGVSGAVQHLVGMRLARLVVAINKDPNAPIFAQADYRIVGDLYQVVPALTKALGS